MNIMDRLISDFDFCFLDTETTGLSPDKGAEVCELAASLYQKGALIFEWAMLIKPVHPIPKIVTDIHGITDEMVKDAPPFVDVWAELAPWIPPEVVLVAHNAPFDWEMIAAELRRVNLSELPNRWLNTVVMARQFIPDSKNAKLPTLLEHLSIPTPQAHRAMADMQAMVKVFEHMTKSRPEMTLKDVEYCTFWPGYAAARQEGLA